jgi:predicted RNA-binding protein with PUA-like domain
MRVLLLKTEPGEYSFDDLVRDGRTRWTGVSNASALIALRQAVKGDQVLIYHTGDEKAIVGLAEVVSVRAYEDPEQPGLNARGEPARAVIDVAAVKPVRIPVTLAALKADARFAKLPLISQGRLSVMIVEPSIAKLLLGLAGLG